MIVMYVFDSKTKDDTIKTMQHALKRKKLKQEYILLYCIDTHKIFKFSRHGNLYTACGNNVKAAGAVSSRGKSLKQPQFNPSDAALKYNLPTEVLSPSRNLPGKVHEPLPTVSQQLNDPRHASRAQVPPVISENHIDDSASSCSTSQDDMVDGCYLVFYNDDKEVNTLYGCFYHKDQLIAVRPEFFERVKQEYDLNQIIYVAELFGVKEITITNTSTKERGVTAGASMEANGITQNVSLERTDYLNENKTLRLTYDLAKSKYIFYTMKEFTSFLAQRRQYIEELPVSYSDTLRNADLYRMISSRLEANMSSYDMDLVSVKKHSYGIALDTAFLTKCGFKIAKHEMHFTHLKIKFTYYNTEDLILSSNLILNRKCFEMIASHSNLLNSYIENFLLKATPREFIKYKIVKQLDPAKHSAILKRVKAFSDLDLTTGSLLEELRGVSPTTLITCDDEGLDKIQELYPYIYDLKRDPRLNDPTHSPGCYNMRCNNPMCKCCQLKPIQSWIIRVYNLHNEKMLMVNRSNTKEFYDAVYRIIINLRHIPNYAKFTAFVSEELKPYVDEEKIKRDLHIDDRINQLSRSVNRLMRASLPDFSPVQSPSDGTCSPMPSLAPVDEMEQMDQVEQMSYKSNVNSLGPETEI